MPAWLQRLVDRLKATHAYVSWERYGKANGDLLAAGVGYYAFFSVFPAVALGFAVFGFVLQDRPDLVAQLAETLNQTLPGMVRTPDNPEGIISVEAPSSLTLTVTGIVSFVTLLLAGLGWVGALRTGIRTIFGHEASTGNAVTTKGRDLAVLATLGLAVLASSVLTSSAGGLAEQVAGWLGLSGNGFVVGLTGALVGVLVDTLIMVLLLRVLSGVSLPWHHLRQGAVLGAAVLTVLKLLGGWLIGRATANPVLGAVAVSVGLLFWLNLLSRVVLLSAAWAAATVDPGGEPAGVGVTTDDRQDTAAATEDGRGQPRLPESPARPAASIPASRGVDRVSAAAGLVVGAAAVGLASLTRRRGTRR